MKILLDTNALLWAFVNTNKLSHAASAAIADVENEIFVSAVSAWELSTKVRLGKLPEGAALEARFLTALTAAGYIPLAVEPDVALRAGRLPGDHRDPFDRMIAAQALAMDIPVISADRQLDGFGVRRIW